MDEIRPARPEDRAEIEAIVRDAYASYTPRIGRVAGPVLDDYAHLIARNLVRVLDVSGRIVGILVLVEEDDALLLDNVAVRTDAQGRGYGRRLMAHAEAVARRAGYARIRLYTNEVMTENIALYGRLGFAETHRAEQSGYSRVFMCKQLAADGSP